MCDDDGEVNLKYTDNTISLYGQHSVIGRSFVVSLWFVEAFDNRIIHNCNAILCTKRLVSNDMDVNEIERLSTIILRHK